MILPNYFLADLPPEATLSPAMITEACQTLKRNRERYLAGRSTEQLIQTLSDVAEGWLDAENRFRKLALEQTWSAEHRLGLNQSQALKVAGTVPGAPVLLFHAPPWKKAWTIFSGNSRRKFAGAAGTGTG